MAYGSSVAEDTDLLVYDLLGSLAHVAGLVRARLLTPSEGERLTRGLRRLLGEARSGRFRLDPALEDVHMNVEAALTARVGPVGEKLHTGRSRNDQVATDLALYLRDALTGIQEDTLAVVRALLEKAAGPSGRETVMASTHLQGAQRVHRAQLLQVHASRFLADAARMAQLRSRVSEYSPLGAGAVAGSSLPLDRDYTARLMGFRAPHPNSVEATADRDAGAEALFLLALLGTHSSGLAEELVLGSTPQFGRVELDDAFVTTSSLMPHKRNPDMAELVRAEAGPLLGLLVAHLTVLKGLPLAYNRDLQRVKPLLLEGVRRGRATCRVLAPMVRTARFRAGPSEGEGGEATFSVELVDALVLRGVPFREAHARVARLLADAPPGRAREFLTPARLTQAFPELGRTGWHPPTPQEEPELRRTRGGSAWREVRRDHERLQRELSRQVQELHLAQREWKALVLHLSGSGRTPSRAAKGF